MLKEINKKSKKVTDYIQAFKNEEHPKMESLMNDNLLLDELGTLQAGIEGNKLYVKAKHKQAFRFKVETGHTDKITSVAINKKYNFVATSSWDGMIKFWDLEDGELLCTFGAFGGSDFVYLSPENYYFASKGALDHIGFISRGNLFSFDQFDLRYNRPDLVFDRLPYIESKTVKNYNLAYQKRLSKLGLQEGDLQNSENIPHLQINRITSTTSYNGYFHYQLKAEDMEEELATYNLLVNGVPVFGKNGKSIQGKSFTYEDSVRLNPGKNVLKFYVSNQKGISSFKKTYNIVSKEKDVSSDLYLISLGCSKYQQSDFDLNFAEKDANDVAAFFDKSKVFDEVHIKKMVNEEVTKSQVEQLGDFIAGAKENDVVILFVAGHGVLNTDLDYFIATYDMDFSAPEKSGIPFHFFEDLLDQTKSRKKLMFVDACHSGEIDKTEVVADNSQTTEDGDLVFRAVGTTVKNVNEVNSFELSKITFADVRESNGSSVLSSAGGGEFAMEGESWSNGVFTYVLLNGLMSGDADLNRDKKIMVSELHTYLIRSVNRITGGRQTPTSRVENLVNDFIIH